MKARGRREKSSPSWQTEARKSYPSSPLLREVAVASRLRQNEKTWWGIKSVRYTEVSVKSGSYVVSAPEKAVKKLAGRTLEKASLEARNVSLGDVLWRIKVICSRIIVPAGLASRVHSSRRQSWDRASEQGMQEPGCNTAAVRYGRTKATNHRIQGEGCRCFQSNRVAFRKPAGRLCISVRNDCH